MSASDPVVGAERTLPREGRVGLSTSGVTAALVILLVLLSLVSSLPQMLALMQASRSSGDAIALGPAAGLRYLREALSLVAVGWLTVVLSVRVRLVRLAPTTVLLATVVVGWLVLVAAYSILVRDFPVLLVAAGVRIVQYVPVALLAYWSARSAGSATLLRVSRGLQLFVVAQAVMVAFQVAGVVGPSWNQTVFGGRAFGSFGYYNQFGATMATCAYVFFLAARAPSALSSRRRRTLDAWMLVCIAMAVLSGSRTAMIVGALPLAFVAIRFLAPKFDRLLIWIAMPGAVLLGLVATSNRALTGRKADLTQEGRLDHWVEILSNFQSTADAVLGYGLGLATNTVVTLFGEGAFADQFGNPHSAFFQILSGFGAVGLVVYVALILVSAARMQPRFGWEFAAIVGLISIPYSIWEFFPTNVLLFFVWGSLLGIAQHGAEPGAPVDEVPRPGSTAAS